ncbi:MAG: acyl-CoA thioesterase [Ktedonobacterales bacterium]
MSKPASNLDIDNRQQANQREQEGRPPVLRERPREASHSAAHMPTAKTVAESQVVMAAMMQPPDANTWGNVHGGAILRMVDEAGGAVAIRHSRCPSVTVAMDSMTFKEPVYVGDLLTVRACLTYVGRTSMEVEAQIEAEDMRTGEIRHAGTCYLVYVAIDDLGHPTPVPALTIATDEERARWQAAERRRAYRSGQA